MLDFDFKKDPLENFLKSFSRAENLGIKDANAMALATVGPDLKPFCRIVLFKGLIREGFSFFTHYNGGKGKQIEENPNVSAVFHWTQLDHQIRIQGVAEKLTAKESDVYFASRPRLSQIGAWVSKQSEELASLEQFKLELKQVTERFKDATVTRPPNWGGYRIVPREMEFWFSKEGRLHERYVYTLLPDGSWKRNLKYP